MNHHPTRRRRNFDNDTCCEAYCPCCPHCDCNCTCNCGCICTKKKMIVPTFILSGIAFILIIIEMITKVSDTDTYLNFKQMSKTTFFSLYSEEYEEDYNEMIDIESLENRFTLSLFIISVFIFFLYLILLICFIYEQTCFADYNPKCKKPYYLLMMILNFVAVLINIILSFIFFTYRITSIDTFKDYSFFSDDFGKKNDLNLSLDFICAIFYLLCLFFHLMMCYYLFREDGICGGCCSEFLNFVNCCCSCLKCCCCCCCCCCDRTNVTQGAVMQAPLQRNVIIIPNQVTNANPYGANYRQPYLQNSLYQESSQFRHYINDEIKNKIAATCQNDVYSNNYSQFKNCPICKINFEQGMEILILPCGHIVHKNCAYTWFVNNKNCPEDGSQVIT